MIVTRIVKVASDVQHLGTNDPAGTHQLEAMIAQQATLKVDPDLPAGTIQTIEIATFQARRA